MAAPIKTLGLFVLALSSVFSLWAQDIEATHPLQENAPVRWAGMSAAMLGHDFAYGYLKNFSDKEVVAVQGGWVTLVSCLDTTKPRTYDVTLGTLKNVHIPPGELSPDISFGVWGNEALALMNAQGGNKAMIVVGIVHVVFADGSEWSLHSDLKSDPTFDDDLEFALAAMRTCFDDKELRAWFCKNRNPPKGHNHWGQLWKEVNDAACGTAK